MSDELIVTLADYVATPGRCNEGGRKFARENGIDWNAFRKNGIPISQLEEFDDAIVKAVIATARRRAVREAGDV